MYIQSLWKNMPVQKSAALMIYLPKLYETSMADFRVGQWMGGGLGGGSTMVLCKVGGGDGDIVVGVPVSAEGCEVQDAGAATGIVQV